MVGTIHPADGDAGARLTAAATDQDADQIVLGAEEDLPTDLFQSLVDCYDRGLVVRSIADVYEELTGRLLVERLRQTWLLSLQQRGETSRIYAVFKRLIDVVAGFLGLVFLAILLPFTWVAIKLEDRGPIFHRQDRVGHFGRPFEILKLRTMRAHPRSDDCTGPSEDDERITRVGKVLRRLHLDELPQAWNILRGDMSVVGPSPEQSQYVERIAREHPLLQHETFGATRDSPAGLR